MATNPREIPKWEQARLKLKPESRRKTAPAEKSASAQNSRRMGTPVEKKRPRPNSYLLNQIRLVSEIAPKWKVFSRDEPPRGVDFQALYEKYANVKTEP